MENIQSAEVKLEKFKYLLLKEFSEERFENIANKPEMEISEFVRFCTDDFIVRIKGFVWSEQLERISASYPTDWWQAFRAHWFPKWLLKKYPVKLTKICLEARALYPKLSFPEQPSRIYLHKTEELSA